MGELFLPDDQRGFLTIYNLTESEKSYIINSKKKEEILGMTFLISDFEVLDLLIDDEMLNVKLRVWDNKYNHYTNFLLGVAVYYDRSDLVDYLLNRQCDIYVGKNLLKLACANESIDILNKLLYKGIIPTLSDFSYAIRVNSQYYENILGLFILFGININSEDEIFLNLPLVAAIDTKNIRMIDFLFSNGLNISNSSQPYIFHIINTYSDNGNDLELVKVLLDFGINCMIKDNHTGRSPYYHAQVLKKYNIAKLIYTKLVL